MHAYVHDTYLVGMTNVDESLLVIVGAASELKSTLTKRLNDSRL